MTLSVAGRFRPTLRSTLATLAAVLVLVALGTWQMQRLEWKTALIARIEARTAAAPVPLPARIDDPAAWDFRPVRVTGRFLHDREMYLSGRTHQGQVGVEVVTPLLRPDGPAVLVNRGWVPLDRRDPASRPEGLPDGTVTVEGIARAPTGPGWMQPDNQPDDNLWFWVDPDAMAAFAGLTQVAPVIVVAAAQEDPGLLPVGGRARLDIPNNHLQYALTWYGLAAVLIVIYVVYHWRHAPPHRDDTNPRKPT